VPTRSPITSVDVKFLAMIPAPLRSVLELALTLAVAVAIALAAQAYVIKPYRVPTQSMVPTLEPGDRVLADRLTLRFRDPQRGDIVVFHPPSCPPAIEQNGVCDTPLISKRTGTSSETFIKRVIGLPGETLFSRNGVVYVLKPGAQTAVALKEPYVHGQRTDIPGRFHVPPGYYFMMGDNRTNSQDSRVWGPEAKKDILGIARVRYWPLDRLGIL
jgi:signal peptidase I